MEHNKNINNFKNSNCPLYPQARCSDKKTNNYSNTNNSNYSKILTNFRSLKNDDFVFDPIAKEISNNITLNFNSRIDKANKLNEAIEMIHDSILDESEDEEFYNMIKNMAINDEDKMIISDIINDEKKHNLMLKDIYYLLTGSNVLNKKKMNNENKENYTYNNSLKKAFFGELEEVKKYRKILSAMTDKENYNKIMEIMIDELTHADKFNYLITKNMLNNKREENIVD